MSALKTLLFRGRVIYTCMLEIIPCCSYIHIDAAVVGSKSERDSGHGFQGWKWLLPLSSLLPGVRRACPGVRVG